MATTDEAANLLTDLSKKLYEERENQVGSEVARQMEVFTYLTTIDQLWMAHLDTMDDLRAGIGLRGYAGRDPLVEYKKESFELFEKLMAEIDYEIVHRIFKVAIQEQTQVQRMPQGIETRPEVDISLEQESVGETKVTIERGGQVIGQETYGSAGQLNKPHGKLGRNDPCYCGSGKKYKKCHYPN